MAHRPFGLAILATFTLAMAAHSPESGGLSRLVQNVMQPNLAQNQSMAEGSSVSVEPVARPMGRNETVASAQ